MGVGGDEVVAPARDPVQIGLHQDEDALAVIASAYPGRKVVGVRALAIAFGGGGVHCIRQQIPAPRRPATAA
ncbi:agmatine deiminase family protein [Streptomyces sp. M-16]|uniref:agmatine deiminase family protein n=1 Tax=Streptomyces sp. M-16 TaxID=3233040 RepID=UPI00224DE348